MDKKSFIKTMRSWENGSITRRDFLGKTGLGLAMAVVAANTPGLLTGKAYAAEGRISATVWPWPPGRTTTARRTSTPSPRPLAPAYR